MRRDARGIGNGLRGFGGLLVLVTLLLAFAGTSGASSFLTTSRLSVSAEEAQGDTSSTAPAITPDGHYIAYYSAATNLVSGDTNGVSDVFVCDRISGETTRASVSSSGVQANANSRDFNKPTISANGRYVAFTSAASNLAAGDGNALADVFVRDILTGETQCASVTSTGAAGDGLSAGPAISADGRYVAFYSSSSNLVAGDTNGVYDVFVRDLQSDETTRVSVSSAGAQANGRSAVPVISADGRHVAFVSAAANLVAGDTNAADDVFVRDMQSAETTRVSVSSAGEEADAASEWPDISADGRYTTFSSSGTNLVAGDTNAADDVFVRDLQSGEITRVSVSSADVQANGDSRMPSISADGTCVGFTSYATNLVSSDGAGVRDVFVRDLAAGQTMRASVSTLGGEANWHSSWAALSEDGRYVAFASGASNLVSDDTNGVDDVFVRDRMISGSAMALTSSSRTLSASGARYTLTGSLTSSGTPLAGRRVVLQTATSDAGPWTDTAVAATTGAGGSFSLSHVPSAKTYYRARFVGDGLVCEACTSDSRYAIPRANVSKPVAPTTMRLKRAKTVYGYLKPRHAAGGYPVRIYLYRYVSGKWKSAGYVKAKARNYSTYTKYSASVKLGYRGKWRMRACHPGDAGHAVSWSTKYTYVRVR